MSRNEFTIADVALANVHLVGDHALNIAFSDGHARGIYPWAYLYRIAETHERLVTKIASGAAACGTCE